MNILIPVTRFVGQTNPKGMQLCDHKIYHKMYAYNVQFAKLTCMYKFILLLIHTSSLKFATQSKKKVRQL